MPRPLIPTCPALALLAIAAACAPAGDDPPRADAKYLDVYKSVVADAKQPLDRRARACDLLRELGPKARPAVPELVAAVKYRSKSWQVDERKVVLFDDPETVRVCRLLGPVLRVSALAALKSAGAEARDVVPAVVECLAAIGEDHDREVPVALELNDAFPKDGAGPLVLFEYEKPDREPKPELYEKYVAARYNALCLALVQSAGEYGPDARAAVPALIGVVRRQAEPAGGGKEPIPGLDDPADAGEDRKARKMEWIDKTCRVAAVQALGRIVDRDDDRGVKFLRGVAALETDPDLRKAAEAALKQVESRPPAKK